MKEVNKLEVLRSDVSIRSNIQQLIDSGDISLKDSTLDTNTCKISELLESTVTSVELENLVTDRASDSTLSIVGVHADRVSPKLSRVSTKSIPSDSMIYNSSYGEFIKNNNVLEQNYVDSIRGNVIAVAGQDSTYRREFDYYDHQKIQETGEIPITNSKDQYKKFFLITDAFNQNKVSNCFKGRDLPRGAALSFWIKFDTASDILNKGLLAFIGDYKTHYFDEDSKSKGVEFVDSSIHLSVNTLFDVEFEEVFHNYYRRNNVEKGNDFWKMNTDKENVDEYGKNLAPAHQWYRSNKAWTHVIISFSNDSIDCYVNGVKVKYDSVPIQGKRFNKHETNESEYVLRSSILDFLSDSTTELYLGMSVDERSKSAAAFFDDITFYDKQVESEIEAKQMFKQASNINLP